MNDIIAMTKLLRLYIGIETDAACWTYWDGAAVWLAGLMGIAGIPTAGC